MMIISNKFEVDMAIRCWDNVLFWYLRQRRFRPATANVHCGLLSKTVWRPTFGHQISRRSGLPLQNYSDFKFASVCLENAYSCPQNEVCGDLAPEIGSNINGIPKGVHLERFRVEWRIDLIQFWRCGRHA